MNSVCTCASPNTAPDENTWQVSLNWDKDALRHFNSCHDDEESAREEADEMRLHMMLAVMWVGGRVTQLLGDFSLSVEQLCFRHRVMDVRVRFPEM